MNKNGFTLLLATLVAGLLLAVGVSIFNIVFKELDLTFSSKESQLAFYASDTGIECALFWDFKSGVFATSSESNPPSDGVSCAGEDIAEDWDVSSDADSAVTIFYLVGDYCSTVSVTKAEGNTTIESRGYNTCDVSNPRRVERGIRVSY